MGGTTELEKLVVKLVADAVAFTKPLQDAQKLVQQTAAVIQQSTQQSMASVKQSMRDAVSVIQSILTPQEIYSRQLKKLDKLLDEGYLSQTYYNRALEKAYETYQKTTPAAMAWQKSLKQANQTQQQAATLLQQMQSPTQRQAQQLQQLNNFYQRGIINTQQYQQALAGVQVQNMSLAQSMGYVRNGLAQTGQMVQRAGVLITAGITAPVAGMIAMGISDFAKFDDEMNHALANAGKGSEQFRGEMEKTAMSLSDNGTNSAVRLAGAYYELITAGLTARESIGNLTTVDKFATSARMDLVHATNMLNNAQTTIGLRDRSDPEKNAANMKRVADVIMKASIMTQVSPEDIARSLVTKSGAQARILGKDIEEAVAAISAFGMQGVKAELAGEQLYIMWRDVQSAVLQNEKVWKAMGIEIYDVKGNMEDTAQVIQNVTMALAGLSPKQKAATMELLGFTNKSSAATKILIGTADTIDQFNQELKNAQGTLDDIHQRTLQSFISQMAITWNQVRNVGIEIGAMFAPYILKMGEAVRYAVAWWHSLDDTGKTLVVVLVAMLAAVGPLVVAFGSFIVAASVVVGAIAGIIAAGWPVALVVAGIVVLFAQWAVAIGVVVAAFAGLALYFYGPKSFSDAFNTGLRIMARLFVAFGAWIVGRFEHIFTVDFLSWVYVGVVKATRMFTVFAFNLIDTWQNIFAGIDTNYNDFIATLSKDIGAGSVQSNFFDVAAQIIKEEAGGSDIFGAGKALGENITDGMAAGMGGPDSVFSKFASEMKNVNVDEVLGAFSEEGLKAARNLERLQGKMYEQIATHGMNARAVTEWKLAQAGATQAELEAAHAANAHLDAIDKEAKELKKAMAIMERFNKTEERMASKHMSPFEEFKKEINELQYFLDKGMITMEAYASEFLDAQLKLKKAMRIDTSVPDLESNLVGSKESHRNQLESRARRQAADAVAAATALALGGRPLGTTTPKEEPLLPYSEYLAKEERIRMKRDHAGDTASMELMGGAGGGFVPLSELGDVMMGLTEAVKENTDKTKNKGEAVTLEPANF